MTTLTANILTEGQVVQLDLGAKTQVLPCRILGFGGTSVVLAPIAQPSAATAEVMAAGRDAYVIVDAPAQQVHALRARVRAVAGAHEVVVSVTDAFQLGQRRRYSRAPLALPVRITTAAGEWETVTRDVSAGGLRVARTGHPGEEADTLAITLGGGLELRADGNVVRRTDTDLCVRFSDIAEQDAQLLQQLAVAFYRCV